jgi:DNA-binding NarL/FixJ family response regulator
MSTPLSSAKYSVYLWAQHPLVELAIQTALGPADISCVPFKPIDGTTMSVTERVKILVIDACSVGSWRSVVAQWHEKQGQVIIIVPEDWSANGLEFYVLSLGICGVLTFSKDFENEICEAVHSVLEGRIWLKRNAFDHYCVAEGPLAPAPHYPVGFTRRERQILEPLLGGLPNKIIGANLRISERTVKYHVAHILRKFNVPNRRQLFLQFNGVWLTPPTPSENPKRIVPSRIVDHLQNPFERAG